MARKLKRTASRGSVNNIILEVLGNGKKYGYEIIKEVEEQTNGKVILKQPSLYSSLNRFEAKGIVTSYWQDSEIGGKRHYYELTPLGIQIFKSLKNKDANESNFDEIDLKNNFENNKINEESSNLEINNSTDNNLSLYDIDSEQNNDDKDIFDHDSTIKLKNYSDFDVSERINALLSKVSNNNSKHKQYSIQQNPNETPDQSYNNPTTTVKIDSETTNENNDQNQSLSNENKIAAPLINEDFNNSNQVNNTKPNQNLYDNEMLENYYASFDKSKTENIYKTSSVLDKSLFDLEANKENIFSNEENNENLHSIYRNIKNNKNLFESNNNNNNLDQQFYNENKNDSQKRLESLQVLYGNPVNYYYPTEQQETITQNEEQINLEDFIKLKESLNEKKFLYNKHIKFNKKEKPYIFSTIFKTKNTETAKITNKAEESNENKLKYIFDEFGIMKIVTNSDTPKHNTSQIFDNVSNIVSQQSVKSDNIIDNVGARSNAKTLNIVDYNEIKQSPTTKNNNSSINYISNAEVEHKNSLFNNRIDELYREKFNYNSQLNNSTKTSSTNLNDSDFSINNFKLDEKNPIEEDEKFVEFENNKNQKSITENELYIGDENTHTPHKVSQKDESIYSNQFKSIEKNNLNDAKQINSNTYKIKNYGQIDSFEEKPLNTKFISINKLKFSFGLIFSILLLIETTLSLFILKNKNLIFESDTKIYIISYIIIMLITLYFICPFLINKRKKVEYTYNFSYSLIFSFLTFIIILLVTYSLNVLFGLSATNIQNYISKLIIPTIFAINILLSPILYKFLSIMKIFYK